MGGAAADGEGRCGDGALWCWPWAPAEEGAGEPAAAAASGSDSAGAAPRTGGPVGPGGGVPTEPTACLPGASRGGIAPLDTGNEGVCWAGVTALDEGDGGGGRPWEGCGAGDWGAAALAEGVAAVVVVAEAAGAGDTVPLLVAVAARLVGGPSGFLPGEA